jgi:transposase
MPLTPDQLPNDVAALKDRLIAQDAELVAKIAELAAAKNGLLVTQLTIEKLKAQIAKLRREKFGASSERMERIIAQLELALEEAETAKGEITAPAEAAAEPEATPDAEQAKTPDAPAEAKKKRRTLPPDLPRRDVIHQPDAVCKRCGGDELRPVGESVTEVLEYIPGRFEVVRHIRPACSCRKCEAMMQAPMPELPILRGMAGASFLAHIAIAKFCDHIPLYRQAEIDRRAGIDIDRGQRAEWLGHVAWLLAPLGDLIATHVFAGRVIHADDTPVPVLAPGAGKTKTGRQWVYLRDERGFGGTAPPAVLYRYTPDRRGEHCRAELAEFTGWLHADGYAGFAKLYEVAGADRTVVPLQGPPRVAEVACWAHVRRYFFDEVKATGSPIAREAVERIGALFDIERPIKGATPERRREVRQSLAKPRIDDLAIWLDDRLEKLPGRSDLAQAIRYARRRWFELNRYLDDGRLEISNNAAENLVRPLKLGAKNWLFAGSDAGGVRAALFYTLIRTAVLNGVEPEAWLVDVIARIGRHPVNRLAELLPWHWSPPATRLGEAERRGSVAA